MPTQRRDRPTREHRVHQLREISRTEDGSRRLLGCGYRLCDHTEVEERGIGSFRRRPQSEPRRA